MIESTNNEKIKKYAKLKDKKYREEMGLFIIEGEHLVNEAKDKLQIVDEFILGENVTENVMKKLTSLTNIPKYLAVAKKQEEKEIKGNILILDNIQDPGNLGTIIRSCVAFGIDTIVASKETVDVYNSKVIRASEGAIFNLNYVIKDLDVFLRTIKDKYTIYTTNVEVGTSLKEINRKEPFAIIMGNEGNGVRKEISNYATDTIYIPISNKMESLNVGVATSIILYEFSK